MKNLVIILQEEIESGSLSFAEIAKKYQVPINWVYEAWNMLFEEEVVSGNDSN